MPVITFQKARYIEIFVASMFFTSVIVREIELMIYVCKHTLRPGILCPLGGELCYSRLLPLGYAQDSLVSFSPLRWAFMRMVFIEWKPYYDCLPKKGQTLKMNAISILVIFLRIRQSTVTAVFSRHSGGRRVGVLLTHTPLTPKLRNV